MSAATKRSVADGGPRSTSCIVRGTPPYLPMCRWRWDLLPSKARMSELSFRSGGDEKIGRGRWAQKHILHCEGDAAVSSDVSLEVGFASIEGTYVRVIFQIGRRRKDRSRTVGPEAHPAL